MTTRRFPLILAVGALMASPAAALAQDATVTDPTSGYTPTTPTTVQPTTSTTTDTGAVSPATTSSTAEAAPTTTSSAPSSSVAPAATSGVAPSTAGSGQQPQQLAYTGADPALVAVFGVALLMLGAGVRLRFANRRI